MTTPTTATTCASCGAQGSLRPRSEPITRKRRHKFGFLWLLFTLITCGFGFLLWLVWPRYNEQVSVDRFMLCLNCGARQ